MSVVQFIFFMLATIIVACVFVFLALKQDKEQEMKQDQSELTERERFYDNLLFWRNEGYSFAKIATLMGISKTSAIRNYKRAVEWKKNCSKK